MVYHWGMGEGWERNPGVRPVSWTPSYSVRIVKAIYHQRED